MGCNNSQLKFKAQALGRYMPPAVAITILLLCMLFAVSLPTPQTVEVVSEPAGLHHHLQGPGVDYYDYSSRMILETVDNPQLGPNFHASSNPQARTVLKKTGGKNSKQFLVPLLSFGPNNQVIQFKWVLMLAKMLKRTVILTGIFEHYLDLSAKNRRSFYPAELLFNISALSEDYSISFVSAEKAVGWNGEISALLKPEKPLGKSAQEYWKKLAKVLDLHVPDAPEVIRWRSSSTCSTEGVKALQEQLKQHRYVLVHPSGGRYPEGLKGLVDLLKPPRNRGSKNVCEAGYATALKAVSKSEALSDVAREYIGLEFGGEPFVAAHVRPFPDTCLNSWAKKGKVPLKRLEDPYCSNGGLLLDLAHSVEIVMGQHKVKRLFVLAHPSIRHRIKFILSKIHVLPSFIDIETPVMKQFYEEADSPHSPTLLLFVEQAIALNAVAFIGTESSTATWSVLQERAAMLGNDRSKKKTEFLFNKQEGSVSAKYKMTTSNAEE